MHLLQLNRAVIAAQSSGRWGRIVRSLGPNCAVDFFALIGLCEGNVRLLPAGGQVGSSGYAVPEADQSCQVFRDIIPDQVQSRLEIAPFQAGNFPGEFGCPFFFVDKVRPVEDDSPLRLSALYDDAGSGVPAASCWSSRPQRILQEEAAV